VSERYVYTLYFCFRLLDHIQEVMALSASFVMPLYTALIHCILEGINPESYNLSSTMMRSK